MRQGAREIRGVQGVVWDDRDSRRERPPLDVNLTAWTVHNRRRSHVNASRVHEGRQYHLKWFFRRPLAGNPARREFDNAREVSRLGVRSVHPVGWGHQPRGTFFVMEGSPGAPIYGLQERPSRVDLLRMARELGQMVATLHNANLCHRDLYVDHVLIHDGKLRLIDVGRVRKFHRRRWIVKDLAGLLFSARRESLPSCLAREFLRAYLPHSRRQWNRRRLLSLLERKARRYSRHNRLDPSTAGKT